MPAWDSVVPCSLFRYFTCLCGSFLFLNEPYSWKVSTTWEEFLGFDIIITFSPVEQLIQNDNEDIWGLNFVLYEKGLLSHALHEWKIYLSKPTPSLPVAQVWRGFFWKRERRRHRHRQISPSPVCSWKSTCLLILFVNPHEPHKAIICRPNEESLTGWGRPGPLEVFWPNAFDKSSANKEQVAQDYSCQDY